MSTMVERVAKAIEVTTRKGFASWEEAARATIEAMREPTPEMIDAASLAISSSDDIWGLVELSYTAAIDEALK